MIARSSAGQGFLRGMGDLRTPLVILVAAHLVNVVLELWFVYGLGWGLAGSAAGTVLAQVGMGVAFVRAIGVGRPVLALMRPLVRVGGEIAVRTAALLALHAGWGIRGVWWGLLALIGVRLLTCGGRFVGSRWALTGAPA
jgi:Na+-driven multidrug efflux pump